MLRGNALAKVDEKGRLKLPSAYRNVIEPAWGSEFFITSLRGESVLVFPMPVYSPIELLPLLLGHGQSRRVRRDRLPDLLYET